MTVHNHGPSQGPGLACVERIINGELKGECMTAPAPIPAEVLDAAVETGARAMAIYDDFDGCFERVDAFYAREEWEIQADLDSGETDDDEEDCTWWRARAKAAFAAVLPRVIAAAKADAAEPTGPEPFDDGFHGCTDQNPDYCACGDETVTTCEICEAEIENGELVFSRLRDDAPWLTEGEWRLMTWHETCPAYRKEA